MHSQFTQSDYPFECGAEFLVLLFLSHHFLQPFPDPLRLPLLFLLRHQSSQWPPAGDWLSPKENPFAESYIPGHMIRKGGEIPMKTRKKKVLTEHAKRQEASFWKMMKAADSGRQCFS